MDPLEQLLNKMIANLLPGINSGIQSAIQKAGLDPWGQVANGSDNFGSINLGICDASANADYNVSNMQGLSSFTISSLVLSNAQTDPSDANKVVGTLTLACALTNNLSANAGGSFEAKCGFMHPSVGIGGSIAVSNTTGQATGTFFATLNGSQACLESVTITNLSIGFGNVDVNIDGLGIFNSFVSPLINAIVSLFNGQISGAIASALMPILNSKVNGAMPQCQNL